MDHEIVTVDQLKDIFYSVYPASTSWDLIDQLYIAIHTDAIVYKRTSLCSLECYHKRIDKQNHIEGPGPQTKGHMALKDIAKEWISLQFGQNAFLESYFAGLHPDVLSHDRKYVIECGTTDPGCITIYLSQPEVTWVGNIPYPFEEEAELMLNSFSKGVHYDELLQKNVSRLRDVFFKQRGKMYLTNKAAVYGHYRRSKTRLVLKCFCEQFFC